MYKNHIEMMVCIDGKPVKEYRHNGLVLVEARKGSVYSIKLKNNFNRRAMAILSVDGIEVLKGKKAEEAEGGYVLDPYSSIEIKGYRISDNEIATFVFGSGYNSYSSYVGQTAGELAPGEKSPNNGVIGVRVVLEKYKEPDWNVHYSEPVSWAKPIWANQPNWASQPYITGCCSINVGSSINAPASGYSPSALRGMTLDSSSVRNRTVYASNSVYVGPTPQDAGAKGFSRPDVSQFGQLAAIDRSSIPESCSVNYCAPVAATPDFDVGTEWGEKKQDKVKRVDFEMSEEVFEMSLYYASREALEKAGVDFSTTKPIASGLPQAFGNKYCTPPKGYKG